MVKALPDIEVVILRMDRVPYIDQSGLYALEDAIMDLQERGIAVAFIDVHGQPLDILERFNLIPGLVSRDLCFKNFSDASTWVEAYCKAKNPELGKNQDEKLMEESSSW